MMMSWLSFAVAIMSLIVAVELVFNKPNKDGKSSSNND